MSLLIPPYFLPSSLPPSLSLDNPSVFTRLLLIAGALSASTLTRRASTALCLRRGIKWEAMSSQSSKTGTIQNIVDWKRFLDIALLGPRHNEGKKRPKKNETGSKLLKKTVVGYYKKLWSKQRARKLFRIYNLEKKKVRLTIFNLFSVLFLGEKTKFLKNIYFDWIRFLFPLFCIFVKTWPKAQLRKVAIRYLHEYYLVPCSD